MDLKEKISGNVNRHPWEIARGGISVFILRKFLGDIKYKRILDVGCGDCFFLKLLKGRFGPAHEYTGIDTAVRMSCPAVSDDGITIARDQGVLEGQKFELVLLMDVLEHVKDDEGFLQNIIGKFAARKAGVYVTAPAFQLLFGKHDAFLGHERRYNKKKLNELAVKSGLVVIESGYFFFVPLIIRIFARLFEILSNIKTSQAPKGVGGWGLARWATNLIVFFLKADFYFGYGLSRLQIPVPGLSVYCLCEKSEL